MASFGLRASAAAPSAPSEPIENNTPWLAAADGKLPLLQASLTQLNLPISAADETGYTLLQAAASYGQVQVMQWLLNQAQQQQQHDLWEGLVNAVDQEGDSALHYAGSLEAVQLLVQVGRASTQLQNRQGKTPLASKQEELKTLQDDEDEDSDSEDILTLQKQVAFLSTLPS